MVRALRDRGDGVSDTSWCDCCAMLSAALKPHSKRVRQNDSYGRGRQEIRGERQGREGGREGGRGTGRETGRETGRKIGIIEKEIEDRRRMGDMRRKRMG